MENGGGKDRKMHHFRKSYIKNWFLTSKFQKLFLQNGMEYILTHKKRKEKNIDILFNQQKTHFFITFKKPKLNLIISNL